MSKTPIHDGLTEEQLQQITELKTQIKQIVDKGNFRPIFKDIKDGLTNIAKLKDKPNSEKKSLAVEHLKMQIEKLEQE